MLISEKAIKLKFNSMTKRYRSYLKQNGHASISSETAAKLALEYLTIDEMKNIILDIQTITDRDGDAGFYFKTVIYGLKSRVDRAQAENYFNGASTASVTD